MNANYCLLAILSAVALFSSSCTSSDYTVCGDYVDDIALAQDSKGRFSFVNPDGKLINKHASFAEAQAFSEGYAVVRDKKGNYSFVDTKIRKQTKEKFAKLSSFHNGFASFSYDGDNYGLLDKNFIVVLEPKYQEIGPYSEGLAKVRKDSFYGFIDEKQDEVIPCRFYDVKDFCEGYSIVNTTPGRYTWGIINMQGNLKVLPEYTDIYDFHDGMARVRVFQYKRMSEIVYKYGFIDTSGALILPCEYSDALDFSEGLCAVKGGRDNWLWHYRDKNGDKVFRGDYESATSFENGTAEVIKYGDRITINRNGEEIAIKKAQMSVIGTWKYTKPEYGVYTFVLHEKRFEFWTPTNGLLTEGDYSRDGDILHLIRDDKYGEITLVVDGTNRCLIWDSDRYYKAN